MHWTHDGVKRGVRFDADEAAGEENIGSRCRNRFTDCVQELRDYLVAVTCCVTVSENAEQEPVLGYYRST
jgi:hypothetical protein